MLNSLPPRLHLLIKLTFYNLVVFLAGVGAIALFREAIGGRPVWGVLIALLIGGALGAAFRPIPADILAAHASTGQD